MEIYAGSPSYLITAGGQPATWAIDPRFAGQVIGDNDQQLGVAVTTSFMPTGLSAGEQTQNSARDLIQFGRFSDAAEDDRAPGIVENYGVAPDFACGFQVYLPEWAKTGDQVGRFLFVNRGLPGREANNRPELAGFYLAIYREGEFGFLEAHDVWLHPELTFQQFKDRVLAANSNMHLESNVEVWYKTQNGNRLRFVIWNNGERDNARMGAKVLEVDYGTGDPTDRLGNAGNDTNPFLNGTILNSGAEAIVTISNPFLGTKIVLDMSDWRHPKRISETGQVEVAGYNNEVWVDFDWQGPQDGDFFHPFKTLAAAAEAVADRGVIKIVPGTTHETPTLRSNNKTYSIVAPIGGVQVGVR
jgi:hypothetical protein